MSEMVPTGSKYTDEQRTAAAIQYAIEGNLLKVEREQGIPESTIRSWRNSDWWLEIITKVRAEKADEHIAQYTQIVDKAQQVTMDKLGDATAAQAHLIACQATDKAQLLQGLPTAIRGESDSIKKLAMEFRRIADDHDAIQASVVSTQHTTSSGSPDKD
jgi:hypothetical protein